MDKNRWLLAGTLFVLLVVLLAGPRGCTTTTGRAGVALTGSSGAEVSIDPGLLERSEIAGAIYDHKLEKTDWLFVCLYRFEGLADLTALPRGTKNPYMYTAKLPGALTSSNAATVQGSFPTWVLNPGFSYKMRATSREVRWWLIVATALLTVAAAYFAIASRRS